MDPISAISLTCNVFQLIEVSFKLITKTKDIHQQATAYFGEGGVSDSASESGALPAAYSDAESVTKDLKACNDRLETVLGSIDEPEYYETPRDDVEVDADDTEEEEGESETREETTNAGRVLSSEKSSTHSKDVNGQSIKPVNHQDPVAQYKSKTPGAGSKASGSAKVTRSEEDAALLALSRACNAVARQLVAKLESLKVRVREGDPRGKIVWKSARGAVKGMWAKGELEELIDRVKGYRQEIQLRVLVGLRHRVAQAQADASHRFDDLDQNTKDLATGLAENRAHFTTSQEIQTDYLSRFIAAQHEETRRMLGDMRLGDANQPPPAYEDDESRVLRGSGQTEGNIISAARAGSISSIRNIIRKDPQAISASHDSTGQTALHIAAGTGNVELVLYCIRNGARLNLDDDAGRVPLHLAVLSGSDEIVRTLVAKGADTLARDAEGNAPIDYAGPDSLNTWILRYGPNLEAKSDERVTSLYHFSRAGDILVVRSLLSQGATTEFVDHAERTSLIVAAERGHDEVVEILLANGANAAHTMGDTGNNATILASSGGHSRSVELLLTKGTVDINAKNADECTALREAVWNGHHAVVGVLLAHSANTELLTKDGWASLHVAVRQGRLEIMRTLLDSGANIEQSSSGGWTPLAKAAWYGRVRVANFLLSRDVPASTEARTTAKGRTPLILAAHRGKTHIVEKLLDKGQAHIEAKDREGFTALFHAAWQNHPETLKALAKRGANLDVSDSEHSALERAAQKGHYGILQSLLEADAKLRPATLVEAARNGHADIVQLLLQHGADSNVRNFEGDTPLTSAAGEGHVDVVTLLLDSCGADIEAAGTSGWSALGEAAFRGYFEVVKTLVERGANANRRCLGGHTPLHDAAMMGHVAVVRNLINKGGADIDAANDGGWTPLAEAAEHGKPEVVKILLAKGANTKMRNKDGDSPRDQADKRKHLRIVAQINEVEALRKEQERKRNVGDGEKVDASGIDDTR
ncbi:MAG: hypothetical protein M1831_005704 [Alyxoria varia]|nr:MAG: hypothetical protein M1831_005704 [Alyxoria varia]